MVTDAHGNNLINVLVSKRLKTILSPITWRKTETIDLVGSFVQSLQNSNQDPGTPYDDRALYRLKHFWKAGILRLFYSNRCFVQRLGIQRCILRVWQSATRGCRHRYSGAGKQTWEYQSVKYVYLETTGHGWVLGIARSFIQHATHSRPAQQIIIWDEMPVL